MAPTLDINILNININIILTVETYLKIIKYVFLFLRIFYLKLTKNIKNIYVFVFIKEKSIIRRNK